MKRIKMAALLCLTVCLVVVFAGCSAGSYTPPEKEQVVSDSALGQAGTLRVGVNADTAPLAGQATSSSKIVGIDVDVAAALADQLGVKLQIVDVGTDPDAALSAGNVDIVMGVDNAEADSAFWKSSPYLSTGVALFGKEGETTIPTATANPKVAAQVSSKSSWRVTNLFGDDALSVENDLKAAFSALSSGKADYVAADAVIGTYVVHGSDYKAQIIALLQDPSGYCVGAAKTNTALQEAVTTAIESLTTGGVIDLIEQKWLGNALDLANITIVKAPATDKTSKDANKKDAEKDKTADEKQDELAANAAGASAGEGGAAVGGTGETGANGLSGTGTNNAAAGGANNTGTSNAGTNGGAAGAGA